MILKGAPIEADGKTYYHVAPVTVSVFDEDGNETTTEEMYIIDGTTRTVLAGSDGVMDFFAFLPDSMEIAARLEASTAYLAPDMETFKFKCPAEAAYCQQVTFGVADADGNLSTKTLKEFDEAGLLREDIVKAIAPGDYFKGIE